MAAAPARSACRAAGVQQQRSERGHEIARTGQTVEPGFPAGSVQAEADGDVYQAEAHGAADRLPNVPGVAGDVAGPRPMCSFSPSGSRMATRSGTR